MSRGPDFLVIGAMKSATTTLHAQLGRQPGFFMAEPKEPNYFSDDEVYAKGIKWYRSLFSAASPGDLCGESSTHYTKLPTYPRTVRRMRGLLPRVKLIYVIRHPIDRLVSQYLHERIQGPIRSPIDLALDRHPCLIDYSRYSMQLEPYLDTYGPEHLHLTFAERLTRHPQQELERICGFLGYEGRPVWNSAFGHQNARNERLRPSALRNLLVSAPVLKTIRRRFVPKSLSEQIKGYWRISNPPKPRLSESSIRRLRDIFDADLERLGRWLGVELSCDLYRETVLNQSCEWDLPRRRNPDSQPISHDRAQ